MDKVKEQLFALNKTSKRSVAIYHKFALQVGLSDSELGVLYALTDGECSQNDLCGEWAIAKQTINCAVSALQKKGLVTLSPVSGARNKKSVSLTNAGRKFTQNTVGVLRSAELDALSELAPADRELYVSLNQKYNESLTKSLDNVLSGRESSVHDAT